MIVLLQRALRWARIAFWGGVICLIGTSGASGKADKEPIAPEVLVLITAPANGVDQVAISFATPVAEQKVRAECRSLIQRTGWRAGPLALERSKHNKTQVTDVSFQASAAVPYPGGMLPVAALVETFRNYRSLVLLFQVQRPFRFGGPPSFENRYVSLSLQQSPGLYRYTVFVKDLTFATLDLPAVREHEAPAGTFGEGRRAVPAVIVWLLVVAIAVSAGLAVYWFTLSRTTHSFHRSRTRRSSSGGAPHGS